MNNLYKIKPLLRLHESVLPNDSVMITLNEIYCNEVDAKDGAERQSSTADADAHCELHAQGRIGKIL